MAIDVENESIRYVKKEILKRNDAYAMSYLISVDRQVLLLQHNEVKRSYQFSPVFLVGVSIEVMNFL